MSLSVKDIMVKNFEIIHKDAPIEDAIRMILNGKIRETGHKTISLMVVDDFQKLIGVITMFDILYNVRPEFLNYGINGDDFSWEGQLQKCVRNLKAKMVHQVMSDIIVSASPKEHLMVILDRMIKNKYRRLPVLEDHKPIGVVYISDIYYHLFKIYK